MDSNALGSENIIFISEAHEKLNEVQYQDVHHKALCYLDEWKKRQ